MPLKAGMGTDYSSNYSEAAAEDDHEALKDIVENTDWDNLDRAATSEVVNAAVEDITEKFGSANAYLTAMDQYRLGKVEGALDELWDAREFTKAMMEAIPNEHREEFATALFRDISKDLPEGESGRYATTHWTTHVGIAINEGGLAAGYGQEPLHIMAHRMELSANFHRQLGAQSNEVARQMQAVIEGEPVLGIADWLTDDQKREAARALLEQLTDGNIYQNNTSWERANCKELITDMLEKGAGEVLQEIGRLENKATAEAESDHDKAMATLLRREANDARQAIREATNEIAGDYPQANGEALKELGSELLERYGAMMDLIENGLPAERLDALRATSAGTQYIAAVNERVDGILENAPKGELEVTDYVHIAEQMADMSNIEREIAMQLMAEREFERMSNERIGDVKELPGHEQERLSDDARRQVEDRLRNAQQIIAREREIQRA